jgi:N-acetylmuramoyl-L-alanine amidase
MEEEQRLRDPDYQRRLAAAIHKGVRTYYYDNPPPGTHIAQLAAQARGRPLRHVIAAGESLYDVAGRYSVSVESLRRANNLADDRPASGTVLEIPFATGG